MQLKKHAPEACDNMVYKSASRRARYQPVSQLRLFNAIQASLLPAATQRAKGSYGGTCVI